MEEGTASLSGSTLPYILRSGVRCDVVETQRYNHAREEVARLSMATLQSLDGIVAVGGDGLFQEVLNGALAIRYRWATSWSGSRRISTFRPLS